MSDVSPIQYTSRTYQTILADINTDPDLRDKPDWWKRIWAGVGDVLSVYLNAQGNNTFLRTSFTRQAVVDLCELIDYALSPKSTSSGAEFFNLKSTVSFPFVLSVANQICQTTGSLAQSAKRFEGRAQINQAAQEIGTFTADAGTDLLTVTRAFQTGEKVRLTTSVTLPDPLALLTDYWVIRVSDTTIKFATNLANAKAGTFIDIIDTGTGIHTWESLTVSGVLYQQRSIDQYAAGKANALTEWQEISLADKNILKDTLVVIINGHSWGVIGNSGIDSSFVFYGATDKVVELLYNADLTARLRFGNGVYGEIPGSFEVYVNYAVGGGDDSNVSENRVVLYGGSDDDIESVLNAEDMTGGGAEESLVTAKAVAPILLKARNRFITVEDGEALVLGHGGFSVVKIIKNEYGTLSCKVVTIANGGGNPSSSEKTALQQYLIDRTILDSVDVRVEDATILTQNVTSGAKMLSGYAYSTVEPYLEIAWQLFFSETGKEIQERYIAEGLVAAIILLNLIFSTAFSTGDYAQLERLIENLKPRAFGEDIQESDALGYIDSYVNGVDYVTATVPSFPVVLDDDEITTDGTLTLSEIV